jgi:hypothetical protein
MRNADSRAHVLKADVIEQFEHVLQQTHLSFVGWGKIGMAAFGTVSQVPVSIPGEEGYTEPRAWGDNCDGSSANRFANINRCASLGLRIGTARAMASRSLMSKAGSVNWFLYLCKKFLHDGLKTGIVGAMHPLLRERREGTSFAREDRQVSFGSADISCNQHCNSSCLRL